ncbi:transcription factor iis [Nannochloropsis oceanica]
MSTVETQPLLALTKEKDEQDDEARSYQPLGLLDTCVKTLARHLEVFAYSRNRYRIIPIDLFLRILRNCHSHAWVQAADTMLRVVQIMPCLDVPEVDELYWRTVCELTLSPTTPITMPYKILLSRVMELKKALEEWIAASITRKVALVAAEEKHKGQRNDELRTGESVTTGRKGRGGKGSYCVTKEEIKGEKDTLQAKSSKKDKSSYRRTNEEDNERKEKRENKDSSTTGVNSSSKMETKSMRDGPPRNSESNMWNSSRGRSGSTSSRSSTAKIPTKQQHQNEDQANAAVLHLLRDLRHIPMSRQLLTDAWGVGDAVRMLGGRAGGDVVVSEEVIQAAIKLRRQWKALIHQEEREAREKEEEKGDDKEGERSDDPMSPARVGARALEAHSWRHVYIFSLEYEKHRREWIGKRALALAEDHESKKRRTRGVEEMLGDAVTIEAEARKGKPPPGNTEKIRKLIKYKPTMQVKNGKRPLGGLTFVPPQKKKRLKVVKLG